jgi:dipeptidyl aminopeptidase/acylaminoacyl peptidase
MKRATCKVTACIVIGLMAGLNATPAGQSSKPPVPLSDFGRWETLAMQPRGGLSPDGRWIAYGVGRSSRDDELRISKIADGASTIVPFGSQPAFSADSRFAAYAIGYSEAQEDKLRKEKKPIHRKLGILNLESGEKTTMDGVESFAFDASGTHLAMKRYPAERTPPPGEHGSEAQGTHDDGEEPVGATVIVRHLASGRDLTFGSVTEFAWQDKGGLLAMTIGAADKSGNGVQLFDPENGTLRVLDSAQALYSGLTWRKDADDLAVLRAAATDGFEGPTHVLLAWKGLSSGSPRQHAYDPQTSKDLKPGLRTVAYRRPSWSKDGAVIFVGVARWAEKPPQAAKAKTNAGNEDDSATKGDTSDDVEEAAAVDVWHPSDVDVMPRQKVNARSDRRRNLLAAWHLDSNSLVQLGASSTERVGPLPYQPLAYAADWTAYAMERTIGRPTADLYLVDIKTGERTKVQDRIEDRYLEISPGGRYLLYLQGNQYWAVNTATRAIVNITKNAATSFVDRESDATVQQKPAFGVAGWTKDDEAVILYDKFDLWRVAADGSGAIRLTNGAAEQVRHRYVRLDPDEEWIDDGKPMHIALFGIWTKQAGYARFDPATRQVERLVFLDKSVDRLARAEEADVYAFAVQAFDDPPDVMVGGPGLKDAKAVASLNPFFGDYAWGHSELVEYRNERGERLQGALFYPAGYEPAKKYPMVVYMYERLSDGLHRWTSPSARQPYNAAVFTSQGYLFFQPDIVFRPREPGLSVVECVGPAVRKVIAMGVADPARVGIVGHSWGGFDTVYLATHTKLFAAGVAGAPITNLVSNYGNHHWSAGIAETDHIETGQQRMEVPIWEDLQAYIRNSAVFGVSTMTTPLLVAFGDNDGTVHWHQGVELYNIARRAKKNVVMLVYGGEDHGLRRKPNQLDYQQRILQWFGHYLKGEPASSWITNGVSHLDREEELKRLKTRKGTGT